MMSSRTRYALLASAGVVAATLAGLALDHAQPIRRAHHATTADIIGAEIGWRDGLTVQQARVLAIITSNDNQ